MQIIKVEKRKRNRHNYTLDDGFKCSSVAELSKYSGVCRATISSRIGTYGENSPLVLHPGPISQKVYDHYGIKAVFSKQINMKMEDPSFRAKCKRDNGKVLCKSYHACQSSRLGMVGFPKWIAPADTDACFAPEEEARFSKAASTLNGVAALRLR